MLLSWKKKRVEKILGGFVHLRNFIFTYLRNYSKKKAESNPANALKLVCLISRVGSIKCYNEYLSKEFIKRRLVSTKLIRIAISNFASRLFLYTCSFAPMSHLPNNPVTATVTLAEVALMK